LDWSARLPDPGDGRRGPRQEHVRAPDVEPHRTPCRRAPRADRRARLRPIRVGLLPLRREAARAQGCARLVHRIRARRAQGSEPGHGRARRTRRLRSSCLRERPALSLQGWTRARAVLGPGRLVGPPLRCLDSQGWRVLRLQVHAAVCTKTGLPLVWSIETTREVEQTFAAPLLAQLHTRGFRPVTAAMDSAYDVAHVHDTFECSRLPPSREAPQHLRRAQGRAQAPECEHGQWTFAGSDAKRQASKWRCPTGGCKPASRWVKASRLHPLVPRESKRWGRLYAQRSAVEREFGRLKHDWALLPLRVRGRERVALHADLTCLVQLASALARARAVPLAA
jgi:hypothetical protein